MDARWFYSGRLHTGGPLTGGLAPGSGPLSFSHPPLHLFHALCMHPLQAARTWARLGKTQYAGDCLRRAMRYAEALEAMVEDPGTSLAPPQRERHTVQLFDLYLTAARHAAATQRQALANNLLSRALALSRHAAAGPVAAVCMCISVAELQLQQAQGMLARGDILLAVALLTTAYQQLCSPDLPLAAVTQEEHLDGLLESKKQVGAAARGVGGSLALLRLQLVADLCAVPRSATIRLGERLQRLTLQGWWPSGLVVKGSEQRCGCLQVLLELCRAYLAANDARMAHKCLEALDREGAQGTQWAASPEVHSMVLRVKLAAGRLAEALHLLSEAARAADPAAPEGQQLLQAWLGGLGMALPHVCPAELHAFQAVVTAFVWRAVAWPQLLLQLVQVLLAQDEVGAAAPTVLPWRGGSHVSLPSRQCIPRRQNAKGPILGQGHSLFCCAGRAGQTVPPAGAGSAGPGGCGSLPLPPAPHPAPGPWHALAPCGGLLPGWRCRSFQSAAECSTSASQAQRPPQECAHAGGLPLEAGGAATGAGVPGNRCSA